MSEMHLRSMELAAADIDFPLGAAERSALDEHLEGCVTCRRGVIALRADQRALELLPRHAPSPAVVAQLQARVRSRQRSSLPTVRLLLVAAAIGLLAMSAVSVGASLMRRDPVNLSVVPAASDPPPTATPSPTLADSSAAPSAGPTAPVTTVGFPAGTIVEVVTVGLRVRTEPTVDNRISVKLDPLLGPGTELRVISGPVHADDYSWYLVEALTLPHRGWVAAADHDGEPWIEDVRAKASFGTLSDPEAGLVAGLRADVAATCEARRSDLPEGALAGVECRTGAGDATRVGAYRFDDASAAVLTYLVRLADYGVGPHDGDCAAGRAGDAPWRPGDGGSTGVGTIAVEGGAILAVGRVGCFLNENDIANVRLTCGSMYVGVLGRDDDIAGLHRWVWGSREPAQVGVGPDLCRPGT